MENRRLWIAASILLLIFCFGLFYPVTANPGQPQAYYQTPTANAEGRIYYIVREGDTCTRVSLLTGVSQDQLRMLNDLKADCAIKTGDRLLLGVVTKPTVLVTSTPTLPALPQTGGTGSLCVYLFEDINGNARADDTEKSLAGGAVSIADRLGKFSKTMTTDASGSPVCQRDIAEGEYNVSVAVPNNYNSTTKTNYVILLRGGDDTVIDFGAQPKGQASTPTTGTDGSSGVSLLFGILGGLLILAGLGLGVYVWKMNQAPRL